MKLITVNLMLIIMIGCGGCENFQEASPETHLGNARTLYTETINTFNDLALQGHVDLELAEKFEVARVRAGAMLEEAQDAIDLGTEFNFNSLNNVMETLTAILAIVAQGVSE